MWLYYIDLVISYLFTLLNFIYNFILIYLG